MNPDRWSAEGLPDLSARTIVVTGANSGIGFHTARLLAGAGADVILACRDLGRAEQAARTIATAGATGAAATGGPPLALELDLSDLASVRGFAGALGRRVDRVDALVNSAGVMAVPRELTVDGFERQLATNHLGHAALTGLLVPLLLAAPAPRVVTVTSFLARSARIRLDDLHGECGYDPWAAYGQSKLANLLFGLELARRCERGGRGGRGGRMRSVVVHPGYARTQLVANGPARSSTVTDRVVLTLLGTLLAQSAAAGALPSVLAAAGEGIGNGTYLVPRGPGHLRGLPRPARPPAAGRDEDLAGQLWERTEALTGVAVTPAP